MSKQTQSQIISIDFKTDKDSYLKTLNALNDAIKEDWEVISAVGSDRHYVYILKKV